MTKQKRTITTCKWWKIYSCFFLLIKLRYIICESTYQYPSIGTQICYLMTVVLKENATLECKLRLMLDWLLVLLSPRPKIWVDWGKATLLHPKFWQHDLRHQRVRFSNMLTLHTIELIKNYSYPSLFSFILAPTFLLGNSSKPSHQFRFLSYPKTRRTLWKESGCKTWSFEMMLGKCSLSFTVLYCATVLNKKKPTCLKNESSWIQDMYRNNSASLLHEIQ